MDKRLTGSGRSGDLHSMKSGSPPNRSPEGRHPIRVVTRRTGLTAAALRAWERRYGAVEPGRTDGGQRLYSDEDIERLTLLRRAVAGGRNISHVARLPLEELEHLIEEDAASGLVGAVDEEVAHASVPLEGAEASSRSGVFLEQAMEAARGMNARELELILTRGAMALSTPTIVDEVMVPLLRRIGLLWARGEMGPATEHMTSSVVRRFLDWVLSVQGNGGRAPYMLVGTPSGQVHEFGALLAGVAAATQGWRVMVLGPDLPGEDIGEAVVKSGANAVALSALLPGEPRRLERELRGLRKAIGEGVPVMIGGAGASEVLPALAELGVSYFPDLPAFRRAVGSGEEGRLLDG
jgi:MerR family transcriptional regulator, light-induced transcriptional regulator